LGDGWTGAHAARFVVSTDPSMTTIPVGLANVQGSYALRYAQIMASAVLGMT
jgi:multiple sugar transport system permease protein